MFAKILDSDLFRLQIEKVLDSDRLWLHTPWKEIMVGVPKIFNHHSNKFKDGVKTNGDKVITIDSEESSIVSSTSESSCHTSQSENLTDSSFQIKVDTTTGEEKRDIHHFQDDHLFQLVFSKTSITVD